MTDLQKQPDRVDQHVGNRVRIRRRVMGLSQGALADALGLTFQQVQKYERGANRVSASKLFSIATTLQVPVRYFFDGLPEPSRSSSQEEAEPDAAISAFLALPEGAELAQRFLLIRKSRRRQQVLDLVRALTEEAEAEAVN